MSNAMPSWFFTRCAENPGAGYAVGLPAANVVMAESYAIVSDEVPDDVTTQVELKLDLKMCNNCGRRMPKEVTRSENWADGFCRAYDMVYFCQPACKRYFLVPEWNHAERGSESAAASGHQAQSQYGMLALPDELLVYILGSLDPQAFAALAASCKRLWRIAHDRRLLSKMLQKNIYACKLMASDTRLPDRGAMSTTWLYMMATSAEESTDRQDFFNCAWERGWVRIAVKTACKLVSEFPGSSEELGLLWMSSDEIVADAKDAVSAGMLASPLACVEAEVIAVVQRAMVRGGERAHRGRELMAALAPGSSLVRRGSWILRSDVMAAVETRFPHATSSGKVRSLVIEYLDNGGESTTPADLVRNFSRQETMFAPTADVDEWIPIPALAAARTAVRNGEVLAPPLTPRLIGVLSATSINKVTTAWLDARVTKATTSEELESIVAEASRWPSVIAAERELDAAVYRFWFVTDKIVPVEMAALKAAMAKSGIPSWRHNVAAMFLMPAAADGTVTPRTLDHGAHAESDAIAGAMAAVVSALVPFSTRLDELRSRRIVAKDVQLDNSSHHLVTDYVVNGDEATLEELKLLRRLDWEFWKPREDEIWERCGGWTGGLSVLRLAFEWMKPTASQAQRIAFLKKAADFCPSLARHQDDLHDSRNILDFLNQGVGSAMFDFVKTNVPATDHPSFHTRVFRWIDKMDTICSCTATACRVHGTYDVPVSVCNAVIRIFAASNSIPELFERLGDTSAWDTVGFIGLGNMGAHMATNLSKAGHPLVVYDVFPEAATRLAAEAPSNVVVAGSPADVGASKAEVIVTMLPSSPHVESVYNGPDGVFAGAGDASKFCIDASTISPPVAAAVAESAKSKGHVLIDAPVSGGTIGAENATLTFMVGAEKAEFEQARAVLGRMGQNIVHCGSHSTGQVAKVANNLVLGISMIAVNEAMNLGVKSGMDPKVLAGIFNTSSARCWSSDTYNPCPGAMDGVPAARGFTGGFAAPLMAKDLSLAIEAANAINAPLNLGSSAHALYRLMCTNGMSDLDFSGYWQMLQDKPSSK
ncbi:uncharacterized protein AMSG_11707 [Thecamonas trahens ATCC 50062]|uniref:3-hydroxyisobutyrate dehydrogenase n=1 Tax=Thecamonas trahens ATCC 50062 TaxID=461836 RepID=A0A0L0DW05_THETB|nr:hypothetical protein AMSG_11707 [Thecamonas trahens ATCC 50062]KNC56400.1 hypothetical protein AMSG_11707 [Thecamonas trahens ATCC 50062]|eukprot:XP_013761000.1 hypothetical protein AMSG_11707 [Thecamonas trahens ATCC 50062]